MLNAKKVEPRWVHELDIYELPGDWQIFISEESCNDEYNCYDYSDGDYRYKIDLTGKNTPIHADPEAWAEFLTYLNAELPEEVITTNSFAIYCWH